MAQVMQDKYVLGQSTSGVIKTVGDEVRLDLELQPNTNNLTGGNINGTVTNSSGTAVANAYVKLMSSTYAPVMHAITDANGKYSLVNITPGPYTIFCIAQGMNLNEGQALTIDKYQDYTVNFTLTADPSSQLAIIAGDLTNTTTKEPINGAVVSLYLNGSNNTETLKAITYSNEYGQYVFREVPTGTYTITISALGYESVSAQTSVTTAGQIVQLNETLTPSAVGSAAGTVSGIITDNASKPINGADVILYQVNTTTNALTPIAFTKTNSNGVYLFTGVAKGTYKIKSTELENVTVNPPSKLINSSSSKKEEK